MSEKNCESCGEFGYEDCKWFNITSGIRHCFFTLDSGKRKYEPNPEVKQDMPKTVQECKDCKEIHICHLYTDKDCHCKDKAELQKYGLEKPEVKQEKESSYEEKKDKLIEKFINLEYDTEELVNAIEPICVEEGKRRERETNRDLMKIGKTYQEKVKAIMLKQIVQFDDGTAYKRQGIEDIEILALKEGKRIAMAKKGIDFLGIDLVKELKEKILEEGETRGVAKGYKLGLEKAKEIANKCDKDYGEEGFYNFFVALEKSIEEER